MVNFAIFNELSLPLDNYSYANQLNKFFRLLNDLKLKKMQKIRINNDFKNLEILCGVCFQQFIGQISDRDLKTKLMTFLANNIIPLENPLLLDEEVNDYEAEVAANYYFENIDISLNGLACAHIFNTLVISCATDQKWDTGSLLLKKDGVDASVIHASEASHLDIHCSFFDNLSRLEALNVTRGNFYQRRREIFTGRIRLCEELEEQIPRLNKYVFQKALQVLMDIDSNQKNISDFEISPESERLSNNSRLRSLREFYVNGEKRFFSNHMKNFYHGYRMHYLEIDDIIYIGYLGTHLQT